MCYRWNRFNLWSGIRRSNSNGSTVVCVMRKEARDLMLGNNWANRAHTHTRKHIIEAAIHSVLSAGLITDDGLTDGFLFF